MTKSKGVDPAVQALSAIQNAMMILSNRVTARGGNLTEALVRLGKGEARYENSLNLIAGELAFISDAEKKVNEINPPEGGRVLTVWVEVDGSMHWGRAIDQGFPDTEAYLSVRRVGGQYGAIQRVTHEVLLVSFGEELALDEKSTAYLWCLENGLAAVNPRVLWAIGEKISDLPQLLGIDGLVLMTLAECTYGDIPLLPYGYWNNEGRFAGVGDINTGSIKDRWFAFEKARSLVPSS